VITNAILLYCVSPALIGGECKAAPLGVVTPAVGKNLRGMLHDRKNNYWFGSDGEGVFRYDGKTIINYTTKDGLPDNLVPEIKEDKAGNILIATYKGISKFDGQTFTTLKPIVMKSPGEGWRLHPDDLWFSAGQPLYRYDGKSLYLLKFPKLGLEDAKRAKLPAPPSSTHSIYTVYKDKRGHLWFGTADAGLCRYDGKTINWLYEDHLTNTPEGGSFGIRSIIEDRDGKLWVCNTKYRYEVSPSNLPTHGLLKYKSVTGTGSLKAMTGDDYIYYQSVVRGNEGDLWMMPWAGGIFRWDGKKLTHYPVKVGTQDAYMSAIYKDRRGDLWICSQTGGPFKFNGKSFEKFMP
jgi:ligand-binding sensor domain-containing protein